MFVPCPHCGFLVALIVGDGAGQQRCPRCGRSLQEDAATTPDERGRDPDEATDTPGETEATAPPAAAAAAPGGEPVLPPAPAPSAPPPAKDARPRTGSRAAPSFTRRRAPAGTDSRRRRAAWLAIAALAVLLALQLLLSQRARLAADAGWRPLVTSACTVLGCTVPPWREPSAWTMLSRDVAPLPGAPGELEVTATFRNGARWPQPPPVLVLSLTDRHGRTVAARAFTPDEYAAGGATQGEAAEEQLDLPALLAAGEAARVRFRVREPESGIVAFSFEFR